MQENNLHKGDSIKKTVDSNLLSKAVEQSANSIVITDCKANILYVNKKFLDTTGYKQEDVIGNNVRFLKSGNQDDSFYKHLWETIRGGHEWQGQIHNRKKSGTLYWEQATISPVLNENGEITHYIAIKEDITKSKEVEEALEKAKQEVIHSYKEKMEFLSVMSHEIRTPLNAIIGVSNMLMFEGANSEQKENLDVLNFSADNLLNLIDDVLDYAKFEAGKLELEKTAFDISDVIGKIAETWRPKAAEKGLNLKTNIKGLPDKLIVGDPGRISQILNNLISNAIKFTEQGHVSISLNAGPITNNKTEVTLKVEDTGIGIHPDKQKELFNPFAQGGADIARRFGGSGLGLAIVKKIAELHKGRIFLNSESGKGSCFSIVFKMEIDTSGKKPGLAQTRSNDISLNGINALLVEDNLINIVIARKWLKKWGATVRIAETGKVAKELIAKKKFDIILLDLLLPDIEGVNIASQIKTSSSCNNSTPIIALTAANKAEIKDKVKKAGISRMVMKPFSPVKLLEAIYDECKDNVEIRPQPITEPASLPITEPAEKPNLQERDALKFILEKWPHSPQSNFNSEEINQISGFFEKNNMLEEQSVFHEWVRLSKTSKDNSGDILLSALKKETLDSMLKVIRQKYWNPKSVQEE